MNLLPTYELPDKSKERELFTQRALASDTAPSSPMEFKPNPKTKERCLLRAPGRVNLLPHHQ